MIEIVLGLTLGFIIISILFSVVADKTTNNRLKDLTTEEIVEKLEQLEKKEKSSSDKLLWFGLGALIGINLLD